ncbi:MAG: hypothetical protein CO156_05245 [Candidatus Pacebacteria bacterium CG_4_9_14_3_um_filter_40_12]|nr:MAG: hypothetical protein COY01_00290 [Candidatus Pacebacteria bacterium CG_4_10_14_0_2_um_filter_40_20]PJA68372.1 MAG: hypothetical protein CO156_05245 [Candidatus Pacebacteria bacterium CG_4_9_14_3_um_filter_40_12]PJC41234.1 MAG: hypothetical protein CO041_05315 [Candidatus Pacebacteria bacterium CG_4_9_14_0_2_um_filter_40_15]
MVRIWLLVQELVQFRVRNPVTAAGLAPVLLTIITSPVPREQIHVLRHMPLFSVQVHQEPIRVPKLQVLHRLDLVM